MKHFEIGRAFGRLETRVGALESHLGKLGEVLAAAKGGLENEFALEEFAVEPGDCPSSFKAKWKNRKVAFVVCAKSEEEARVAAEAAKANEVQKLVREVAGLDCSTRKGCVESASCNEKWSDSQVRQLGPWTCTNTGERGRCSGEDTVWKCSSWFDIQVTLSCKCERS